MKSKNISMCDFILSKPINPVPDYKDVIDKVEDVVSSVR